MTGRHGQCDPALLVRLRSQAAAPDAASTQFFDLAPAGELPVCPTTCTGTCTGKRDPILTSEP